MQKTVRFWFFILGFSLLAFCMAGCAGSQSNSGSFAEEAASMQGSEKLEKAKQDAEEAEFEAHRLREELYRKRQSQQ